MISQWEIMSSFMCFILAIPRRTKKHINGSPEGCPLAHDIFAGRSPESVIVGYTHSGNVV